ncbi:hypothetical protein QA612_22175 [Evansella sp. AB-P1]|uniref:immunoglobulin-like domain-containing protein n=1 Tax=Evansella sp. AB-P1 TaxID=3037653 RepID=UPI00241EFD92|nr:immunoglobulin-like domain-containing protein [Evansella sp. AB-P1]MDG5790150.1 hypothetical protein [Evansella sp. AB-P1]
MRNKKPFLGIFLFGLMFLVACGTTNMSDLDMEKSALGELQSSIGDVSTHHESAFDMTGAFNEGLSEKTEYGKETDKWFDTGFVISAGKKLPGERVTIQLTQHPDDLKLRYQLTERNDSLEKIDLIEEEISSSHSFEVHLPDKEGVLYLLSVEVIDENDQVEDTLLSLVGVPLQSMNAKLYTDKDTYQPNNTVTLLLENFGPTELFFGTEYFIEKYENTEWHRITFDGLDFDDVGITLKAKDIYEQSISLPELPQGDYRIVKNITSEGTELEATLATEFQISGT